MLGQEAFSVSHFAQRMSPWTLRFLDPKQEQLYQSSLDSKVRFPMFIHVLTYVVIFLQCSYRIVALISAATTRFFPCGSVVAEIATLIFLVVCMLCELLFHKSRQCRFFQGFCFYIGFPIVSIAAAFYTQQAPRFGLMYLLVFPALGPPSP